MTPTDADLRDDLTAVLRARAEVPGGEDLLAEQFLARLERSFETSMNARIAAELGMQRNGRSGSGRTTAGENAVLAIPVVVILLLPVALDREHAFPIFLVLLFVLVVTASVVRHVTWRVAERELKSRAGR